MNISQQIQYQYSTQRSAWLALIALASWCGIALILGLFFVDHSESRVGLTSPVEAQIIMGDQKMLVDTRLICATRMVI